MTRFTQEALLTCAAVHPFSPLASHRRAVHQAGATELCLNIITSHKDNASVCYWTLGVLNNVCRDAGAMNSGDIFLLGAGGGRVLTLVVLLPFQP